MVFYANSNLTQTIALTGFVSILSSYLISDYFNFSSTQSIILFSIFAIGLFFFLKSQSFLKSFGPIILATPIYLSFVLFAPLLVENGSWFDSLILGNDGKIMSWPFSIQSVMWFLMIVFISYFILYDRTYFLRNSRSQICKNAFRKDTEMMQFITWSIPTFGFLGTVIGMSLSLGMIGNQKDLLLALDQGIMQDVISALSLAFNTTILGLTMNVICMFFLSRLQKRYFESVSR